MNKDIYEMTFEDKVDNLYSKIRNELFDHCQALVNDWRQYKMYEERNVNFNCEEPLSFFPSDEEKYQKIILELSECKREIQKMNHVLDLHLNCMYSLINEVRNKIAVES